MPPEPRLSAGDAVPQHCQIIEVRVAELRQLFNAIDPSPFRERDLDSRAEEFIVEWARDFPRDARLALWFTSNGAPAARMRHRCLPSRFTSTSSNALSTHDVGFASCFGEGASA